MRIFGLFSFLFYNSRNTSFSSCCLCKSCRFSRILYHKCNYRRNLLREWYIYICHIVLWLYPVTCALLSCITGNTTNICRGSLQKFYTECHPLCNVFSTQSTGSIVSIVICHSRSHHIVPRQWGSQIVPCHNRSCIGWQRRQGWQGRQGRQGWSHIVPCSWSFWKLPHPSPVLSSSTSKSSISTSIPLRICNFNQNNCQNQKSRQ